MTVCGIGGTAAKVTTADLQRKPQHSIELLDHGMKVAFEGVRLSDVMSHVDVPVGKSFEQTAGWYYVLVEGADGNRAVFSWAEIDPTFCNKPVFVITKRNGNWLSDDDGPFRLIVEDEANRTARWLRKLSTLRIRQGG